MASSPATSHQFGLVGRAFLLALAVVPCRATTLFTDSTFSLAGYSQTTYTNNTVTAGASYSVTQDGSLGNSAPSAHFSVTWTNDTTFTIFDGLINSSFTYDPSTAGAIASVDFSLDRYTTFTAGTVVLSNATAGVLLEQGGNFYLDSLVGPAFSAATWQTVATTGLTASSFCLYSFTTNAAPDCSQNPDFSASGGVIDFGFRAGLGHSNALGTGTFDSNYDNLSITINTVPEPSSGWMLITSVTALVIRTRVARRRQRGSASPC